MLSNSVDKNMVVRRSAIVDVILSDLQMENEIFNTVSLAYAAFHQPFDIKSLGHKSHWKFRSALTPLL